MSAATNSVLKLLLAVLSESFRSEFAEYVIRGSVGTLELSVWLPSLAFSAN